MRVTIKNCGPLLSLLILLNILCWIAVFELSRIQVLEVTFFDVGQGDAILIESPQRHQILIDGGPTSQVLEKLNQEMPFWDRSIDLIILTHPEHDHISGLIEVLKRYKVKNILWTGAIKETSEFSEWQRKILEEGASIKIALAGQIIIAGSGTIQIIYPQENLEGKKLKNINDTSIVARLIFGQTSFLFSGDISKLVEKKIAANGIELDSDILKISHHGSSFSGDEDFIKKVSPDIAVISVGKENQFGHPHQETLEKLFRYDIKVLRTDQLSDIKIISDGEKIIIK